MKTETYFCLVLSESQARFFATSKYGIDRMKALMSLVELASTENRTYEKKGFSANLNVGQLVMSEVELSRLWKCDRKTVSRVLDTMNELGIVSTPAFIPCCASLPGISTGRWLSIPTIFR